MESEGKIYFFFSCECVCVCENIQQKEYMAYSSASPSIRYCVTLSLWKIIFLHIEIFPINVDSNTKLTQSNNPSQLLLPFHPFISFVSSYCQNHSRLLDVLCVYFLRMWIGKFIVRYMFSSNSFSYIFFLKCTMLNIRRRERREEKGPSDFFLNIHNILRVTRWLAEWEVFHRTPSLVREKERKNGKGKVKKLCKIIYFVVFIAVISEEIIKN